MKREHPNELAHCKALTLAAFVLVATALAANAATEERVNKHFTVTAGGTLVVDVAFGSIEVSTNDTSEVVVDAWRKVGRKNKAQEEAFLRDNPIEMKQDGSKVTIHARGTGGNSVSSWSGQNINEANYVITVPPKFSARLQSGGGGMSVSDLTGEFNARAGGGGLGFARLEGPLDAETGGGGIHARDCKGALKLNTGGGGVDVAGGSGSLDGTVGGGGITVKKFQGPVHVICGGGGLQIEEISGDVRGSTGGGGITLVLPWELTGGVDLSTGGAGIEVSAPGNLAFNLDAETGGGSVWTDLPVTVSGHLKRGRLKGPVNGGGKAVVLRTGGGGIVVKKR
jgi:DUF4097 and DUF4098 domain-containing protein YvlB